MRTDPFRDLVGLARAFDATSVAPLDAYRLGDVVTVEVDLPGADPESIDVQIERGELRISASRRQSVPEGARHLIRERPDHQMQRRLMLGDVLDVDHVDADYAGGVLTVRIPLHDSAKPRRIGVRSAEVQENRAIMADSGS